MGDGGAYLIGFTLGALCIALVQRNAEVSAWFAVLLLVYPLTEVGFSVWRRRVAKGKPIGIPDAAHLHHLIYRLHMRICDRLHLVIPSDRKIADTNVSHSSKLAETSLALSLQAEFLPTM